jgi:hypothetical protein
MSYKLLLSSWQKILSKKDQTHGSSLSERLHRYLWWFGHNCRLLFALTQNEHFLKNLATCDIHIGQGNAQSNVEISFRQSKWTRYPLYGNSTISGARQRCLMRMNPHWMRSSHFSHFHATLWCELWWQCDLINVIALVEHPVYGHSEWAMSSSCVINFDRRNQLVNSGGNLHRMECDSWFVTKPGLSNECR